MAKKIRRNTKKTGSKIVFSLLLVFSISILACTSSKNNTSNSKSEKELVLKMTKTSCYGCCPAYVFEVFNDNSCKLTPRSFAFLDTTSFGSIMNKDLNEIIHFADSINFWKLNAVYDDTLLMDAPSTFIYLKIDGKEKQIKNRVKGPEELKLFENLIESKAKSIAWKHN